MAGLVRMEVGGVKQTVAAFERRARKTIRDADRRIEVGYSAPYAMRVHEDLQMRHTNGQAKYLSAAIRQGTREVQSVIRRALVGGQSIRQALALGGIRLLQLSRKLVPVRTGRLRDSGFSRVV